MQASFCLLKKLYMKYKQVVRSLISVCFGSPPLGHTKKKKNCMKLQTVDPEICSNLIFLKKGLGPVFPSHFVHDF